MKKLFSIITTEALLSLALAFVFIWFGLDKIIEPGRWAGWAPSFAGNPNVFMQVLGTIETIFGLGLLLPWRKARKWFSVLVSLHLLVVVSQVRGLTGVRDFGLFLSSLALTRLFWTHD
ncbi:MAG: hypothetical protein V1707_01325 [bacterium]